MAQILIKRRKHFAEDVQPAQWSDIKWAGRPLRGDIVEIRPNGYWRIEHLGTGERHWPREAFALIQLTNVDPATIAYWHQSYSNATETEEATVVYKSRYRLTTWESVPWQKHIVTVGGQQVEEWYYVRDTLIAAVTPGDKVA